jgi:hypothetical protein
MMATDAVVRHVGDAVLEPLDRDIVRIERGILDPGERREPVDALAFPGPEAARILDGPLIHGEVLGVIDVGAVAPFGGNLVDLLAHAFLLDSAQFGLPHLGNVF